MNVINSRVLTFGFVFFLFFFFLHSRDERTTRRSADEKQQTRVLEITRTLWRRGPNALFEETYGATCCMRRLRLPSFDILDGPVGLAGAGESAKYVEASFFRF